MGDGRTRWELRNFGARHWDQMNYPPLRSTSIAAAVRGVLCHGGIPLGNHSRRRGYHRHLPASAEKCSRTTGNHEIVSRRSSRSSWLRIAAGESASQNGPDRGTVAFQDLEGGHTQRIAHGVSDFLAGNGGRSKKSAPHERGTISPHHPVAIDGHNVGDACDPDEISYGGWRSNVGFSRVLERVGGVSKLHNLVCQVNL